MLLEGIAGYEVYRKGVAEVSLLILDGEWPAVQVDCDEWGDLCILTDDTYDLFADAEEFHDWFYDTFGDRITEEQLELVERWLHV